MQPAQQWTGVYHDPEKVAQAVRELIDEHTPIDEIVVTVRDRQGEHRIPLQHRTAMLRDGVVGAALGAVIGGALAAAVGGGLWATDALPTLTSLGPVWAGLGGALVGGAGGGFVGGLFGLDHWWDEADLRGEDLERGAARISVHNGSLQERARRVFERTGASHIEGQPELGVGLEAHATR